jgi:hypothetical protein
VGPHRVTPNVVGAQCAQAGSPRKKMPYWPEGAGAPAAWRLPGSGRGAGRCEPPCLRDGTGGAGAEAVLRRLLAGAVHGHSHGGFAAHPMRGMRSLGQIPWTALAGFNPCSWVHGQCRMD